MHCFLHWESLKFKQLKNGGLKIIVLCHNEKKNIVEEVKRFHCHLQGSHILLKVDAMVIICPNLKAIHTKLLKWLWMQGVKCNIFTH